MGKLSRDKGAAFERKVARDIRTIYPDAERNLEYNSHELGTDVIAGPFRIQCKRMKGYSKVSALYEIQQDDKIKLLVTKADRKPELVVLLWGDFLEIIRKS
jgi:hypothetical protein